MTTFPLFRSLVLTCLATFSACAAQAQIKVGEELHKLGRDDEAIAYLQKLVDARTDRSEAERITAVRCSSNL